MNTMRLNDRKVIALNAVGLSLARIGKELGVHHTTVKQRLNIMGIPPADTRRAFMEEIWESLSDSQKNWLMRKLGAGHSVKDYLKTLIVEDYIKSRQRNEPE